MNKSVAKWMSPTLTFAMSMGITTAAVAAGGGTWTTVGSMQVARIGHAMAVLPNGKVLVAGGATEATVLSSAEIYDPATALWTPTTPMNQARYFPGTVVLQDGRILLVAGSTGSGFLDSAEIYDPTTQTWTPTQRLAAAFDPAFSAVLLQSGKVLVAGGYPGTDHAEIFDPATGSWTTTGSLKEPRYNHRLTLLADGTVLAVGGGGSSTAEIYDPATGDWTYTAAAPIVSHGENATATLLGTGKVLAAGGASSIAAAELYDPGTSSWASSVPMNQPRVTHGQTVGKVLVSGGFLDATGNTLCSAETYTPDTTPPQASLAQPRAGDRFTVGSVVQASYTCSDNIEVLSCAGTVPSGAAIDTSSVGNKQFTVTATDSSRLVTVKTVTYAVTKVQPPAPPPRPPRP